MKFKAIAVCAFVLVFAATSVAQTPVHFRGKVEDGEQVCYYCPGSGFVLDCTPIRLVSTVYNLNAFMSQQVEGWGTWNGSTSLPFITITTLQLAPESFSISGGANIGTDIDFTVFGPAGSGAVVAVALGFGITNFGDLGLAFLNTNSALILGAGTLDDSGEFAVTVDIPDDPALVGIRITAQGLVAPIGAPAYITNPDCKQVDVNTP